MREDPAVVITAQAVIKSVWFKQARRDSILTIAADVGEDIRDAHHAALERHGSQVLNRAIARGDTILDRPIELPKGCHVRQLKHALLVLAVMAQHAIERLKRHVAAIERIEHAHRLHVMEKETAGALVIDIVEEALAGMTEGRMPQVMAQTNRLDQVAVEPKGATDIARNARDELHMQTTTRQVIIATEAKDLRFTCIAGVCRQMKDLFGIAHKGRTHQRAFVRLTINSTNDLVVVATIRIDSARSTIGGNALDQLGRQHRGNTVHTRLDGGRFLNSCHGMLLKKDAQSVTACNPRPRLWQKSAPKTVAMAGSAIL